MTHSKGYRGALMDVLRAAPELTRYGWSAELQDIWHHAWSTPIPTPEALEKMPGGSCYRRAWPTVDGDCANCTEPLTHRLQGDLWACSETCLDQWYEDALQAGAEARMEMDVLRGDTLALAVETQSGVYRCLYSRK